MCDTFLFSNITKHCCLYSRNANNNKKTNKNMNTKYRYNKITNHVEQHWGFLNDFHFDLRFKRLDVCIIEYISTNTQTKFEKSIDVAVEAYFPTCKRSLVINKIDWRHQDPISPQLQTNPPSTSVTTFAIISHTTCIYYHSFANMI